MKKIFFVTAVIVGLSLFYFVDPAHHWFMPKCPFKILTGLNCPACGIQRAIHAALMGHWAQAIKYNYFLLFAGPYVLSFAVQYLMPQSRAKQRLGVVLSNRYLVNTYVVTFLVWLAVRNLLNL